METKVFTSAKTLWRACVKRREKPPEVIIDVEINGEDDTPDEMRQQITAAAEGFSEQVKRILEGTAESVPTDPTPDAKAAEVKQKPRLNWQDNRTYMILCDWVSENADKMRAVEDGQPCYGLIENGVAYIVRSEFDNFCIDREYNVPKMLCRLKENGLLVCDGIGFTNLRRIGNGQIARCVCLILPQVAQQGQEATK